VWLVLNTKVIAHVGKRGVNPRGRAVHDHEVRTVPDEEAVDHLFGEIRDVPVSITGHDHTHAGSV
jgi:hypothetical protein